MRNNRLRNLMHSIQLIGRGRFYWRLWTPLLIGIAAGLLNGLFAELVTELQDIIPDLPEYMPTGIIDLSTNMIMGGAGIAPLFAFLTWWSTDSTRSRLLANGSLTNYMLLPFSRSEKTFYLVFRTTVLPFLIMCTTAFLTLRILHPELLTSALRMTVFASGMSILIGVIGWSGSWSHLNEKIFGESISMRSQKGIGSLMFLILISLPFPALTSGSTFILFSILPYAFCFFWLKSRRSYLEIEGCFDSYSDSKLKEASRNNTGKTPVLNSILRSRIGKSRLARWLLLNSFNNDPGLLAIGSQTWQKCLQTRLFSIPADLFVILLWLLLFFRGMTLTSEIIGLNLMLVSILTLNAQVFVRKYLPMTLPLRGVDIHTERTISLSLSPVLLIPMIAVCTTTVLQIFPVLQNALGWNIFEFQQNWFELTGSSIATAFLLLPAGIAWTAFVNIFFIAAALILNSMKFFRAAQVCKNSFEIRIFMAIAPVIILLGNHSFLIEANKLLLLLGGVLAVCLYLCVSYIGDKKLQRVFP